MHPENKGKRNRIEQLKWKKRLKNMGIPSTEKDKFTCYKTTGKPCSCYVCSPKGKHYKDKKFEIDERIFPTEDDTYLKNSTDEDNF